MNPDAWSQGQIRSKIWMIEQLERFAAERGALTIWVLGGWYAISGLLIFARGRLNVKRLCSFDIDPAANAVALQLNNTWAFDPMKFFAYEQDCANLAFTQGAFGPAPDVVINSAMEHFSPAWIERVPRGTLLCLQSTDMVHAEHVHGSRSLDEFKSGLEPLIDVQFAGERAFEYPTLRFSRFMIIGRRR